MSSSPYPDTGRRREKVAQEERGHEVMDEIGNSSNFP
jgi:hypothetical protein